MDVADREHQARQVRGYLLRSEGARLRRVEARAERLRGLLPEAARRLAELGAKRVWLFGSPVWGPQHEGSDLDLATEGLPPGCFFQAYEALWELADEPLDLVALETAAETLRARILSDGQEIWP